MNRSKINNYRKNYYQSLVLKNSKVIKATPIWLPFGMWYKRRYDLKDKVVLDFGSSIASNFFKKYVNDNRGNNMEYYGFDLDNQTVKWLRDNDFYYDFYGDDKLKGKFDIINASQVYEHLTLEERGFFIKRSHELLKRGGLLLLDFPYINNLNLIEFFHGDRTHKPVSCEDEAIYIKVCGFECKVFIGGFTWPYQSLFRNVISFIWNILLGYYPFHITLIEATKK